MDKAAHTPLHPIGPSKIADFTDWLDEIQWQKSKAGTEEAQLGNTLDQDWMTGWTHCR